MGRTLQVIGGLVQIAGIVALAAGITQTREAYLPGVDGWWTRAKRAITARVDRVWERIARRTRLHSAAVTDGIGMKDRTRARGRKAYGPLP